MKSNSRAERISLLLYLGIFLFLLLCNSLTMKVSDDFTYHFSFHTRERITSILQIFPSMLAHASRMNGRLVAHFWVQVFELLPKGIFNIVNSAVFTLQIALLHRIATANAEQKSSAALIAAAFCSLWLFQPAFGQVNLWLDGACNYLWAGTFGLLFLLPYVDEFLNGRRTGHAALRILFPVFGFLVGAYSENGSAAVIFTAALLTTATLLVQRRRPTLSNIVALVFSAAGYLTLYLAPAEISKKSTQFTFAVLRGNFINCVKMLETFFPLFAVLAVLLVLSYFCRVEVRFILLSLILTLGALAANFIMMFAGYYEGRSAFCTAILLTGAVLVLADKLGKTQHKPLLACALAVALLPTAYHMLIGLNDIYNTRAQIAANEAYIYECKEQNIPDIRLPILKTETKYSSAHGLKYLDTSTTETWPNVSMSRYYGVNSILGK